MRVFVYVAMLGVGVGAAMAQQAPPIKMGLWEKTLTDNAMGKTSTETAKSCVNAAEFQRMVANINRQRPNCTTKVTQVAKGYTMNATCNLNGTTMTITSSTMFTDSEHIVTESHTTSIKDGQKREIEMHSTSRWLGADCGNIKPGDDE